MSSSVTTKITTVQAKVKRPAAHDDRREQWNRTARFIWRVFIVSVTVMVCLLFKSWEIPEVTALVAERMPDVLGETVEFFTKME